jgi:uncharacterized protein (DUF362 family)/Pyruvate/2-oxoacid:ferredoxin oxidoreductase delta subunit
MKPRVSLHQAGYNTARRVVDRIFEIFPPDVKGKRVLIKPNVLRVSDAQDGIVTHPAIVRAVVEAVETMAPAELVVGDNPGVVSYGANEESFRRTGLMEASCGHYRNIGNDSIKIDFNPVFQPSVSVSRAVLDADCVISLPKFKTHGLTVLSGAIKNSYGILPGAQKAKLHRAAGTPLRFHELLVEVFRLRVPDLFIVDAVVGMEGNGPASPDLRDIGLILAADNAVALDAVIATLMGCDPGRLRFLQRAKELGLGDYDLQRIQVLGELQRIPNFKLPPLSGEAIQNNQAMQAMMDQRIGLRPQADPQLCSGCGTCVEQCPVSALSMNSGVPEVAAETCIRCFCCQELCPEKAITLR